MTRREVQEVARKEVQEVARREVQEVARKEVQELVSREVQEVARREVQGGGTGDWPGREYSVHLPQGASTKKAIEQLFDSYEVSSPPWSNENCQLQFYVKQETIKGSEMKKNMRTCDQCLCKFCFLRVDLYKNLVFVVVQKGVLLQFCVFWGG